MLTKKIKDERAFCIIFYLKKRRQILYCPSSKKKIKEGVKGCFSIFIMVSVIIYLNYEQINLLKYIKKSG